jgi:hypothetical protein
MSAMLVEVRVFFITMHGIYVKKITMLFMRQIQLPGVNFIFQKDENCHYTKLALLYQDIIRYSIVKIKENPPDKRSFTHRELAKWILENNKEYINYYKDPSTTLYP